MSLTIRNPVRVVNNGDLLFTYFLLDPSVPCCDICHPALFDRTRPGVKPRARASAPNTQFEEEKTKEIEDALYDWRETVFARDEQRSYCLREPSSILPDEAIEKLAMLKLPLSAAAIEGFLAKQWVHWSKYGRELTNAMLFVDILPRPPPPSEGSGPANVQSDPKRSHGEALAGEDDDGMEFARQPDEADERAQKRLRTDEESLAAASVAGSHEYSVFQSTGYHHAPG